MPGPRSICRAPAGWVSIRLPACSPAKGTFRWRPRRSRHSAAPVSGVGRVRAKSSFIHEMTVTRIHEDPRVTSPTPTSNGTGSDALGDQIDARSRAGDMRLTMGGEPTFVSIDDMDGEEWNTAALGPQKRKLAGDCCVARCASKFAPGGLLHYGQGKWYPGEPLPRWA